MQLQSLHFFIITTVYVLLFIPERVLEFGVC